MQPFEIKLSYEGRHWLTVPFELGHDEIGSTRRVSARWVITRTRPDRRGVAAPSIPSRNFSHLPLPFSGEVPRVVSPRAVEQVAKIPAC